LGALELRRVEAVDLVRLQGERRGGDPLPGREQRERAAAGCPRGDLDPDRSPREDSGSEVDDHAELPVDHVDSSMNRGRPELRAGALGVERAKLEVVGAIGGLQRVEELALVGESGSLGGRGSR